MIRKLLTIPLALALALSVSCKASWITTVQQYVQVLTPVASEILQLLALSGADVPSVAGLAKYSAQFTSDLNLMGMLVKDYNSANAADTRSKINAAAEDALQNLSRLEQAAHIYNPKTQEKVGAAVTLGVNVIQQLLALIPGNPPMSMAAGRRKLPPPHELQKQFEQILAP